MDIITIIIAFGLGLGARMIKLPPMVGFLAAGLLLNIQGIKSTPFINEIADIGVSLLLFTIGLKLKVKSLVRGVIWKTALAQVILVISIFTALVYVFSFIEFFHFRTFTMQKGMIIGLALSFSSTVFAVKILEEKGGMISLMGKVTIGILIIQDIIAVIFLSFTKNQLPSPWTLLLIFLPFSRPILIWIMKKSGHGELLLFYGFALSISAYYLFDFLGIKADLGSLVIGAVISNHPKSEELADELLRLKDFFLIAFFLTIGMSGNPESWLIESALVLTLLIPIKGLLFFILFTRLKLRSRTSFLSSLLLSTYSEFGLIVVFISVEAGWLGSQWLLIMALAIAFSFIIVSPLNNRSYTIYARLEKWLLRWEGSDRLPDDELIDTGDARILIFGMGRIGTGAYDYLQEKYGKKVLGLDSDPQIIELHQNTGRNVKLGDATDSEFWEKLRPGNIDLVLLAMTKHASNVYAAIRLKDCDIKPLVGATAKYNDQIRELKELGVHEVFNIYDEAGSGFGNHMHQRMMPTV